MLTPTAATDLEALNRLKGVVISLGADVLLWLPTTTGWWPWFPCAALVAATLMNAATDGAEHEGPSSAWRRGDFHDMTTAWPPATRDLARHLRGERCGHHRRARCAGHRPRRHATHRGAGPGRAPRRLQKASAARRNLPARAVRPDHLAELRIPVPIRAGVLAESHCWRPIRESASTTSRSPTRPRAPVESSSSSSIARTPTRSPLPWRRGDRCPAEHLS